MRLVGIVSTMLRSAQVNLLPSTTWGFAPVLSAWHFTTPLATSAGSVADAAQAALPFQVRVSTGAWTGVETRHFRLAVHGQYGTFDTGVSHSTGYGGSLSLSFFAGRGQ